MPHAYSPTYYEDQKKEHDFYINLGNQCRIAKEKREAFRKVELEEKILQGYNRKLDEAKRVLEKNRQLLHALKEYNYNKDRELVLLSDRIAWRELSSTRLNTRICYYQVQTNLLENSRYRTRTKVDPLSTSGQFQKHHLLIS
jgi:hypothetical protein